jgi:hypothetical protein
MLSKCITYGLTKIKDIQTIGSFPSLILLFISNLKGTIKNKKAGGQK